MTDSFRPVNEPLPPLVKAPPERVSAKMRARVLAAVPIYKCAVDAPPVTALEVSEVVGCTVQAAHYALKALDHAGLVLVRPRHSGARGRPPLEYWRIA